MILDYENGRPGNLAIVDYKTKTLKDDIKLEEKLFSEYQYQMAVYAAAARSEGLGVSAGYIHDLKKRKRVPVDVSVNAHKEAIDRVKESVKKIRRGEFKACPEKERCGGCDYKLVCKFNLADIT